MTESNSSNGLSEVEVLQQRVRFGSNALQTDGDRVFWQVLKEVVLEPMFLLLVGSSGIYLLLGEWSEALILFGALCLVAAISFLQEYRSRKAIHALRKLSAPMTTVVREGIRQSIPSNDLVVGDCMLIEEGELIAADGQLISSNDFSVNESILTGESFPIQKSSNNKDLVYRGCLVASGSATVLVQSVGTNTQLGRIGASVQDVQLIKTPLQQQIRRFVHSMVWIGIGAFLLVVAAAYYQTGSWTAALLQGFTMAMSVLPEEIPVAFSVFMALGAYRLMQQNKILVKQPQYVETLGSATVICADKTGTITQNRMHIQWIYDVKTGEWNDAAASVHADSVQNLMAHALWASETDPFDPMEKAIHQWYAKHAPTDERNGAKQIHEYPLGGKPPRMTHVFSVNGQIIIAVKGAVEGILNQSNLSKSEQEKLLNAAKAMASDGLRVLGVGKATWQETHWPATQDEFVFECLGMLAFQDPPKENIAATIQAFRNAGIQVKMITGDYAETATSIAREIGLMDGQQQVLTGEAILQMDEQSLQTAASQTAVFARMFPEAKLKVIRALQDRGEVVAMTGDGVNDGPALRAAHIGIAMGKRGSELAKSAAALILTDDDLAHMVDAVAMGRRIYTNLQKAIQYIISIHVPILLIVSIPCLFFWQVQNIFSPLHVIVLELIMGPTCSIVFEHEPMEPGTMLKKPRSYTGGFLSWRQLMFRLIQGSVITAACLIPAFLLLEDGASVERTRTWAFSILVMANMMLTMVSRSSVHSMFARGTARNTWMIGVLLIAGILLLALIYFKPAAQQFGLEPVSLADWGWIVALALSSTLWVELHKLILRRTRKIPPTR
jgi:Ca2+-transporting ATPase